jgi:lipoate-protein ligase A
VQPQAPSDPPQPTQDARWRVEHRSGTADELHHAELPSTRTVVVAEVERPALVLGSTQDDAIVDQASLRRAGVELARRRSGGGAVLLVPGEHVWVDLVLPAGDPLWQDDVEMATWWVGEAFARVVERLVGPERARGAAGGAPEGSGGVQVHRRAVADPAAGRVVCFGASGPGEVLVGGAKLVGLSQRRTRAAARFQCVLHRRWRPDATLDLLDPAVVASVADLRRVLEQGVTSLELLGPVPSAAEPGWSVVEELLHQLP